MAICPPQTRHHAPSSVIARGWKPRGNLLNGFRPSQDHHVAIAPRDDDYGGNDTKQKKRPLNLRGVFVLSISD